jgi:hypothetical protein
MALYHPIIPVLIYISSINMSSFTVPISSLNTMEENKVTNDEWAQMWDVNNTFWHQSTVDRWVLD